jgi:hypothetical protein
MARRIKNAMSIDVEDYFQVSAFAPHIRREDWDALPCRVERNVDVILGLLDEADAKATFFTLGWIAERYPQVVRRIVDNGHELASHGYGHQRASDLTPEQFREDITRAKRMLEDLGGVAIRGYRAPSFSINRNNWWAVEELENAGYVYSSSIYPVRHDHYGMPDAPRGRHPRTAAYHGAADGAQLARRGRWLVSPAAVFDVALDAESRQCAGRCTLHVLFPSLGTRCRAAASDWLVGQDPLPSLRQSATYAGQTAQTAERF